MALRTIGLIARGQERLRLAEEPHINIEINTKKGSFEDTVLKATVAKAVKNTEQRSSNSWSLSTKMN